MISKMIKVLSVVIVKSTDVKKRKKKVRRDSGSSFFGRQFGDRALSTN